MSVAGVSKVVTVDIKGNWQRWLKVRDLTKGVTYLFRVQARTIAYGPELQANITAGPAEGERGLQKQITSHRSTNTGHQQGMVHSGLRVSLQLRGEAESRDVIQCISQLP